ncbi:MAG: PAS domain S-box protein [Deltaproteobacteria bacterium]|nr:PAS domain S-box protein [Deltaproteobacteria bacterium]
MAGKPTREELEKALVECRKEEKVLRERDGKYRVLVDAAGAWVNEVDPNGVYTYVNPKVKDLLGYLPEELIGKTIFDFMAEEDKDYGREFFETTAGAQKSFSEFISTHIHKDGRKVVLEANGAPFFDSSGTLKGYWGLGRDVTKRIRAKEELGKSEEKWRSVVENAPNMILILDREGTIKFINRTVDGYLVKEAIGTKQLDYIEPEYHALVAEANEQVFRSGKPGSYILKVTGPRNDVSWYETHVGPLENDGEVVAVTLISTDITGRKKGEESLRKAHEETEKQVRERTAELLQTNEALESEIAERKRVELSLQESEQRFRSLVEATSDMVWELDLEGKYTYVSPKAEDLMGRKPEELIGRTPFESMPAEEAKKSIELFETLSKEPTMFPALENVVIRKDGRRINVETSGVPILNLDGKLVGFRGIDRDISERVRSRENLFQAAKMVSLGTLVSGVAHEINNPITSIMLNGPMLQKIWGGILPVLDDYCKEHGDIHISNMSFSQLRERVPVLLSGITEGTKRVKRIVGELKNFAQQRPSDLSEEVNINKTVKKAVVFSSNLSKKATNHFHVEYADSIPSFKGNTQRIEQVAINLIINACEALSDNKHSVRVSTAYDEGSDSAVMTVSDQGEGMLPEVLERIGDPFFTTKRDIGGTGLGLAISKKIIEDHGGKIEFDSVPGEGTTVKVMVPASHTTNNNHGK